MAMMTYSVTTPCRDNVPLQGIEEAAGSFGIYPTNPVHTVDLSIVNSTRTTYNTLHEMYQKLGNRNVFKFLKTGHERTWSMDWSPVDTQMIRYITENGNAAGTLTGTIDKSLSLVNSVRRAVGTQALTEHYIKRLGTKGDSITVTTTSRGLVECSADMISRDIPKPTTTSPLGTGTLVTPTTADPWKHSTGGLSKLTLGGVVYPMKRAEFTVNNNLDQGDVDGSDYIEWLEPTKKEVTFEADIVIGKNLTLEDSIETFADLLSASLVLNTTGPKVATFVPPIVCTGYPVDRTSDQTAAEVYTFSFKAADVMVTA
jgi:hypothetical protein